MPTMEMNTRCLTLARLAASRRRRVPWTSVALSSHGRRAELGFEEAHDPAPGVGGRTFVVDAGALAEEAMPRARINLDVVGDAAAAELLVERAPSAGGEVPLGIRAHDRADAHDSLD